MPYLYLYSKTQEETMGAAQQITDPKPIKALPTRHFELPDELRSVLFRASDLIRRRCAELREEPLPTSLAGLDHLLGGGLPRGEMVELVGRGSCGRFAALLATLRAVTGAGEAAAFVDQGAQLDPQAAAEVGIDLERLLWLRPQSLGDSLAVAELLVHTGFPLVVLDLGLPPVRGRAPLAAWLRLARNAATHRAVVLVGSPYRLSGCAAGVVVAAGRGRGDWSTDGAFPLLNGIRAWLHRIRRIGYSDHDRSTNVLTLPEASFGLMTPGESSGIDQKSKIRNSKSQIRTERRKNHVTAL
jgi:hypothetical protein